VSIGAQPLDPRGVRAIIDRKMADFSRVARGIELRHLHLEPYLEAAREADEIRFALETGYMTSLSDELRDPVIVRLEDRVLYCCPPLASRVLSNEPAEIHRAFVEGAFFRKLFRFFVPAAHEGGAPWEMVEQVREIMQRHFAWQLVVTETLLGQAS
jgi:hypothetical protein